MKSVYVCVDACICVQPHVLTHTCPVPVPVCTLTPTPATSVYASIPVSTSLHLHLYLNLPETKVSRLLCCWYLGLDNFLLLGTVYRMFTCIPRLYQLGAK